LSAKPVCKDCASTTRKLTQEGPRTWRCASCRRERKTSRSAAAHESRVQSTYGLEPGQYEALYKAQGGRCYICRRATGKTRRLSVDHDHATGAVRALLCRPCNSMLGHVRDDIETLRRAAQVIRDHPAQEVLLRD